MLVVSLCLELLASVVSMLLIIKFGVNRTGPLVTDVFSLALILYFIVLFTSFILLIKHYFVDQGAINRLEEQQSKMEKGFISVRSRRKTSRIDFDKLVYIESLADYIAIHTENGGEVVSREKISHMENRLPDGFLRIHRSFIVNVSKITSFSREELVIGETKLPVSRTYRSEVISRLQKL
jgi:two-component system response regulator LytT